MEERQKEFDRLLEHYHVALQAYLAARRDSGDMTLEKQEALARAYHRYWLARDAYIRARAASD